MLALKVAAFTEPAFYEAVATAAEAKWSTDPPAQVRYLAAYLQSAEAKAKTVIVERPYVDRHYMQEYVGYYATRLHPPPARATRLHFWSSQFDEASWEEMLGQAARDGIETVEAKLAEHYLGYVVVRPLETCPIGRTVLRTYDGKSSRDYGPARTIHDVHLCGFRFRLRALPFQQQDQGLGACTTTAIWCALSRVMRADGGRAVTPLDVARAAEAGTGVVGAEGMKLEEMSAVVRRFGYEPHVVQPSDEAVFTLALKACIRGGIPVVLRLIVENEVHAVTVAGMRTSDADEQVAPVVLASGGLRVLSRGLSRLYVHDDRLGPYARFLPATKDGALELTFAPQQGGFSSYEKPVWVETALVPLYPKIRMSAVALVAAAGEFLPFVRELAGEKDREDLYFEPAFALGGDYLRELGRSLSDAHRLVALRKTALLSRYIGVLRFVIEDRWFMDLIVDTTDVRRDRVSLLAAIAADARDADDVNKFVRRHYGDIAVVV